MQFWSKGKIKNLNLNVEISFTAFIIIELESARKEFRILQHHPITFSHGLLEIKKKCEETNLHCHRGL